MLSPEFIPTAFNKKDIDNLLRVVRKRFQTNQYPLVEIKKGSYGRFHVCRRSTTFPVQEDPLFDVEITGPRMYIWGLEWPCDDLPLVYNEIDKLARDGVVHFWNGSNEPVVDFRRFIPSAETIEWARAKLVEHYAD
jgi:hypothetical protein